MAGVWGRVKSSQRPKADGVANLEKCQMCPAEKEKSFWRACKKDKIKTDRHLG
jgi:hypothetical protein